MPRTCRARRQAAEKENRSPSRRSTARKCSTENELRFQKDPETNRFVVRVVNRNTREVISQVPEEYVLRLAADIKKDLKKLG
jgi:uncharacterized FlaG/YvyC family protein